jgi:SNF2 family DNA or RNA helicase
MPQCFLTRYSLATYHEISKSHLGDNSTEEEDLDNNREQSSFEQPEEGGGLLHQLQWLRVILDEGHAIKNHNSLTSRAAHNLKARYHWILSGTPLINNITELYSYFNFLRVPSTDSLREFKKSNNPAVEDGECLVKKKLKRVMIRRTHQTILFGQPILALPVARENVQLVRYRQSLLCEYSTIV